MSFTDYSIGSELQTLSMFFFYRASKAAMATARQATPATGLVKYRRGLDEITEVGEDVGGTVAPVFEVTPVGAETVAFDVAKGTEFDSVEADTGLLVMFFAPEV